MKELIKKLLLLFKRKPKTVSITYLDIEADIEISMNDKYVIIGTVSKQKMRSEEEFLNTINAEISCTRKFIRVNDKTNKLPLYVNVDDIHKYYVRHKVIRKYTVEEEVR